MDRLRKRQVFAYGCVSALALGFLVWQTAGSVSEREVPTYRVTPPAAFNAASEPTIVDVVKLSEPLLDDADIEKLVARAQRHFDMLSALSIGYDEAVRLTWSQTLAGQLVNQMAPVAQALAGASAGEPEFTIVRSDGRDAAVTARAIYTTPSGSAHAVKFEFAYTNDQGVWKLSGAALTEGPGV